MQSPKNNSPPHKYAVDATCTICHDVLLDPVTTPCGHNYCKMCLDRWLKRCHKCPLDNCPLPKVDFEVNRVLQKLLWEGVPAEKLAVTFYFFLSHILINDITYLLVAAAGRYRRIARKRFKKAVTLSSTNVLVHWFQIYT